MPPPAVDDEMEHLLKLADDLHRRTHGILDPTLLPLLRVWDWRQVHLKLPQAYEVQAALALTGWQKVQRRPAAVRLPEAGMGLDFGGYARHFTHDGIRCGHILDPRTGWPVLNGMRAATVIAPSCLEAGIYCTAVFVLARPRRRGLCAVRVWHRRLTQFWKVAR